MKVLKILLCVLLLALPVFAEEAEDRQTATSLHYVTHELDTRQNKLSAGTNKALTYTNTAGNIEQRTVKENLTGGTTDTSLPMVNAVNAGLNTKQDDISAINDHTAVTYTGQTGTIGAKGIYQDTGTYAEQSDNLIDAKTFNAALKNGLDSEFVCSTAEGSHDPVSGECWLWMIHNNTLPDEYTRLEYIESTGTQYINTEITTKANTLIKATFQFTSSANRVLFGKIAGSTGSAMDYRESSVFYWYRSISGSSITSDTNKHTIDFNADGKVYRDGIEIGTRGTFNNNALYPFYLFAELSDNNQINYGKVKIYSFELNEGDTPVRKYIPAKRRSDNAVGMYDTVSGAFFTNAATSGDDFTAGDPINNNVYLPQGQ